MKTLFTLIGLAGLAGMASAYTEDFSDWNLHGNPSGGYWYYTYDLGSNTADTNGWTILGDPGTGVDLVGAAWTNPPAPSPEWIDLAGTPGPGGIEQFFVGPGGTYSLSFAALSNDPDPNTGHNYGFTVSVNGTQIADYAGLLGPTWTPESLTFMAGPSFTLAFYTTAPNNGNVGLANLSLTPAAAPEPFTMGLGIAGIGMFIRRRMKAKA